MSEIIDDALRLLHKGSMPPLSTGLVRLGHVSTTGNTGGDKGTVSSEGAHMTESHRASTHSHVTITGRMGGTITERELPSGDVLVAFTVVVDRPKGRRPPGSSVTVDALPCQVHTAALRSKVAKLPEGVVVEVEGVLRRRFWRSPGGLGSALEVEVSRISACA